MNTLFIAYMRGQANILFRGSINTLLLPDGEQVQMENRSGIGLKLHNTGK